ncbi:phosphoribosylglycinamide formyltransferase [candidate division TA06 bacterium]|uniref:Phosphoribosylglycinamide formyltransferase n=1 Tax=candidate division TA06 bacterium TaxID=2250710 RepID=A0A660SBQ7_UNCT6|nr:MAG: phosphoribosylglycinamide formyltransferase [candidate division TA06 bacterium]
MIFISGRGSNLLAIAKSVEEGYIRNLDIVKVISDNPEAEGLFKIREKGIDSIYVYPGEKISRFDDEGVKRYMEVINKYDADYIFLAGFMRILDKRIIDSVDYVLNIHPSLLPSFKGLHAQRQAIEYGVKVSGCTVHFVDTDVDTGPIILQRTVPVFADDTEETLSERILKEEHKAYPDAIKLLVENRLEINGRIVKIKE